MNKIEEYLEALRTGNKNYKVNGLCGRIIRGKKSSDFETLTDDPERKIVMLIDETGLQKMIGKNGYEMLIEVGYEPDYLEHKVKDGNQFKLVIFEEGKSAKLATWDNMLDMVEEVYPDLAAKQLYLLSLKNTSFNDYAKRFELNYGATFLEVEKLGKNDQRYMTYDKFLYSNKSTMDFRAFLYFTIHLRELYSGDGYTYDSNGKRGVKEYIIPNRKISELGEYRMIDLDVKISGQSNQNKNNRGGTKMGKNLKVDLVIIDPQNDFCDQKIYGLFDPSLPVPGGYNAMSNVAKLVKRIGNKLNDIHVTMDSHRLLDIAHPGLWMDQKGNPPPVWTIITANDVKAGIWTARIPSDRKRFLDYVISLEAKGKYQLQIWPPHCLIGKPGWNVQPELDAALDLWSVNNLATVDFVTKGSNPYTEHYGALEAEVPDPTDPGTTLNTGFLTILSNADIIVLCGLASSHCLKETGDQIVNNIGQEHVKKIHILTDCTAPVGAVPGGPNYPEIAARWLKDMEQKGVTLTTSTDFML